MKRTLELNPDHADAHNYLGYLYAEIGINLDEALEHVKKALESEQNNGFFLDSLGWVYYKKGLYDKAIEELEKAILLVPPDPVIFDHLGDVYFSKNDYERAKDAWEKSLKEEKSILIEEKLNKVNILLKNERPE